MALDPSIITSIKAPTLKSPAEHALRANQLRQQFLEQHVQSYKLQAAQRQEQAMAEMQQIVMQAGGIEPALPILKQRFPMEAMQIEKELAELKKAQQGTAPVPFTLSPGQARYDPSGKVIAEGPAAPVAQSGFTLGPGQQRFDAQGQPVASVEAKPGAGVNVGSFEDYVIRKYGPNPTAEQITEARKVYQQADDRPQITVNTPRPLTQTAESNVIGRLANQWTAASKSARELDRAVSLMDTGIAAARRGDMAAGSQAVLVTFQKALDPTSVVRESEYARSAAGQALLARIQGAYEKLTQGGAGVPLAELEKFARLAKEAVAAQKTALGGVRNRIGKTADRYNIPRELVFESDDIGGGAAPATAAPSGGVPSYQDYLQRRGQK